MCKNNDVFFFQGNQMSSRVKFNTFFESKHLKKLSMALHSFQLITYCSMFWRLCTHVFGFFLLIVQQLPKYRIKTTTITNFQRSKERRVVIHRVEKNCLLNGKWFTSLKWFDWFRLSVERARNDVCIFIFILIDSMISKNTI